MESQISSILSPAHLVSVLVVEDHLVARLGLVTLITAQSDLMVCGEAESGEQAIQSFRELKPDVALVDMRLPDMDGDVVVRTIVNEFPNAACLCLSTFDGEAEIARALRAGALGYVVKDTGKQELLTAIRKVADRCLYLSSAIASKVANYAIQDELSAREIDVLRQVSKGLPNKLVADQLAISEETVKSHVRNILSKLGVSDRTAAVVRAVELGIIRLTRPGEQK